MHHLDAATREKNGEDKHKRCQHETRGREKENKYEGIFNLYFIPSTERNMPIIFFVVFLENVFFPHKMS